VNILDTDALSHHMKRNAMGIAIRAQMMASPDPDFWISAVSAFEIMDGATTFHKAMK
jgi:predicted nucleic acid-binding protein